MNRKEIVILLVCLVACVGIGGAVKHSSDLSEWRRDDAGAKFAAYRVLLLSSDQNAEQIRQAKKEAVEAMILVPP